MEIILNEQPQQIPANCSVQQLVDSVLPEKQKGIAVAVNQTVVAKNLWNTHLLNLNDKVLIIKATQGG